MTDELLEYFKGDALAASVWLDKYAQPGDKTPDDMHRRMAKKFARIEENYQEKEECLNAQITFAGDEDISLYGVNRNPLTEESIYNMFKDFKYIIPQGSVMSQLGNNHIGSLSNCFVVGQPHDSYAGIMQKDQELAQLMKRRGGVGLDISTLRPSSASTSNAAKSSTGAVSFMERFSNTTREVAQNGRRGALMLSIDVRHPDSPDFAVIKNDSTKVTGANISIFLHDDFMEAVEKDEDYLLRFPVDMYLPTPKETDLEYNKLIKVGLGFIKKVKAKELYDSIVNSAWQRAEPGQLFVDRFHSYSPDGVYPQYRGVTTNPSLRHNTLIQTDLGLFPIKHLAEKDGLTIVKNVLNEWQVGKVFMSGKDKDLYKITFTNGYEVFCTAEHKWVVLNSAKNIFNKNSGKVIKKRTDEIMFGHPKLGGDRIPVPFKPDYEGNVSCTLTNDEGFLAGYYLGDGHKSQCSDGRWQYGFIVSEKELECCGSRLLKIINTNKSVNTISNWNQDHNSKALSTYVSQIGFVDYCETLTLEQDKSLGIPKNVWTAGANYIKGFIDGLFSSDGSVWDNKDLIHSRITLTTSREKIALDVQKLLNLFGIISRVYHSKNKDGFNRWDLTISGIQARKFTQTFKLTSSYKQEKLNNILSFENTYKDNREYLVVKSVENTGIKEDVYDITVYDDTHTFMGEFGVTGNCGEIFMQKYDACRLIAMNLFSFVENPFTEQSTFNFKKFYEYCYEMQRLMDDLVDLELEHIDRILDKIEKDIDKEAMALNMSISEAIDLYRVEKQLWLNVKEVASSGRRTGSGITALGDCLAALGLAYDSDEGIQMIDNIFKSKMEAELDCTIDLAILRGPFKGWDVNKELPFNNVTDETLYGNEFYQFIFDNFPNQAHRMADYGRRNVSWSTVAPTGTVSLMAQTTSGLEPLFMGFYTRRVKVNPGEEGKRVDFTDQNGDNWMEMPVLHQRFKDWVFEVYKGNVIVKDRVFAEALERHPMKEEEIESFINQLTSKQLEFLFKISPWYGSTANDIDWVKRVEIQGVIQKYISHSISSTINLPNSVTEKEVAEIYIQSWKMGLKGVTVYRDGCRSGVLINNDSKEEEFAYVDAIKRPKQLESEIHFVSRLNKKFTVIVGLLEKKPYEVFITEEHLEVDKNNLITKKKSGLYETKEGFAITTYEDPEVEIVTRLISTSLRHRADIKFIVEQLNKISGDMFSFSKVIARVLKKYIPNGETSTMTCQECGGSNVVFEEGCSKCKDCGSSKCG